MRECVCSDCASAGAQAKRRQGREEAGPLSGLSSGLRMLGRSPLFLKLTACVMLTGIVMEGMYELLAQYFQLKLGYTAADQVSLACRLPQLVPFAQSLRMCIILQAGCKECCMVDTPLQIVRVKT